MIKTDLSIEDYKNLTYKSYLAKNKNKNKLIEIYKKQREKSNIYIGKDINVLIGDNKYKANIKAYRLVLEYYAKDYKCKYWELQIKTFYKIIFEINKKDENLKIFNETYILVDNKEYYVGDFEIKKDYVKITLVLAKPKNSIEIEEI